MPYSRIFKVANMPFDTIRENKILAKFSEFTVYVLLKWLLILPPPRGE